VTSYRLAQKPKLNNKISIIIDFENQAASPGLLKKIYETSEEHYFQTIHRILIVNLNLEGLDPNFGTVVKSCPNKGLISVYDKEYKQNLIQTVKMSSFISMYGGLKKYTQSYNLCNNKITFDFDV
jgi:hypothetical protein